LRLLPAILVTIVATVPVAWSAPADPPPATASAATPAAVDSLTLLERKVARDSTDFASLYRLGVLYLDRDRPDDAILVMTRAQKLRPKDLKLLVNLGAAHDAAGHGEVAQRLYREALEVAPGDSVASCRLASSLYARGKHQEAVDIIRDVIQRAPGSYCAYFTLGVAFADAGIYRDAIRMWQKVVELAPGSPEAISAQESITVLQKFVQ